MVLLLVWSLVPAMACTLQDAQMTPAEHSCCVQMHQHCGDVDMPASHGCCHKQVRTEQSAVATKDQHLPQFLAIAHAVVATQIVCPVVRGSEAVPVNASPPLSPLVSITILRI